MSKLAIEGGTPLRTTPYPPRKQIDKREILAVMELMLDTEQGGAFDRYGGIHVDAYEEEFAHYIGVPYATACSAGTAAIHTALGALQLEPFREIISSPITDPGAVAPILWQNCIPIFADADPETMNMGPESLKAKITDRTGAIICGHIAGNPCEMDAIVAVARSYRIPLIEDCAQAHGAIYDEKLCGSLGDIAAFSLMSGKHSTAGGQGGMVVCKSEEHFWNAKRFADRGKPFNSEEPGNLFLGNNYRMTELEACIGRVQLEKLPEITGNRRQVAQWLADEIADLEGVHMGKVYDKGKSAYWFANLRFEAEKYNVGKGEFAAAVAAEGVPIGASYEAIVPEQHWILNKRAYGTSGFPWDAPQYGVEVDYRGCVPGARQAVDNHMRAGIHEGFSEEDARDIGRALRKVEQAYLK